MQHMRVLPPGAVAGARRAVRLGDRSNGRSSRSPGRARATCCASSSIAQFDLANEAFPLSWRRPSSPWWAASPARLFRISFSGELAYEIAVPARYGDAVIARASWRRAQTFGIAPYGTEALGVMRIEKGHVAGNEINGQTTARDLGLGRMMSTQEGLHRPRDGAAPGAARRRTGRRFVGFKPVDRDERAARRRAFPAASARRRPPTTTRAT